MSGAARGRDRWPLLSIVTPAFNEAENLPVLHARLEIALARLPVDWEWVVVDDHSRDATFDVLERLGRGDGRVRGVRLARNAGAHAAIACGLAEADGAAVVVLAADLQDPPEVVPELVAAWRGGAQVVWAARMGPEPRWIGRRWASRLYYRLMRRITGLGTLPPAGADCVLLDRVVVDAVRLVRERHVSLLALIAWMGFRQAVVPSRRDPRRHGRSGWTFGRQIELLVDSVTGFTYLPIRLMSYLGLATAMLGLGYAAVVVANAVAGHPPVGWTSLMVAILLIGGVQMLMMGVLGEYVWRALAEARARPRYLVEARTDSTPAPAPAAPTNGIHSGTPSSGAR